MKILFPVFLHLILVLLMGVLSLSRAQAEYRVFRLQWTNKQGKVVREATSTLDPLQFPTYYQVPKDLQLSYNKTWMCRGSTSDFKPHCLPPEPPKKNLPSDAPTPSVPASTPNGSPALPKP